MQISNIRPPFFPVAGAAALKCVSDCSGWLEHDPVWLVSLGIILGLGIMGIAGRKAVNGEDDFRS